MPCYILNLCTCKVWAIVIGLYCHYLAKFVVLLYFFFFKYSYMISEYMYMYYSKFSFISLL